MIRNKKSINFVIIFIIIINCYSKVYALNLTESMQENKKEKIVYLTFDDGPSMNNTPKILQILNENRVKATFFVVGTKSEECPNILKYMSDIGMSIEPHTYSHDYKIFTSEAKYMNDLNKCIITISKIIGKQPSIYVRIPGGSNNSVCNKNLLKNIRNEINNKNMDYIDWNVSCGDAISDNVPYKNIVNNVKKQIKNKDFIIILMHDSYYKKSTVKALPEIIKLLKENGYKFKTFEDIDENDRNIMFEARIMNRYKK